MRTYLVIGSIASVVGSGSASAGLLDIELLNTPDTLVQAIDISYSAATDAFAADGLIVSLDQPPLFAVVGGAFDLDAQIDDSGSLISGDVTLTGTIAGLGFNSGTLLTGSLTAFGFDPGGGDPLEFIFEITGGDAAGLYGGAGSDGGIILTQTGFSGSFAADFTSSFAVADVGALVPAPGVLACVPVLIPVFARRRRAGLAR